METNIDPNNPINNQPSVNPSSPPSLNSPITASTTGWLAPKIIAFIVGALILIGGGSYFAFFAKSPASSNLKQQSNTPSQSNNTQEQTPYPTNSGVQSTSIVRCKDIFTNADFEELVHKNPNDYTFEEKAENATLSCIYNKKQSADANKENPTMEELAKRIADEADSLAIGLNWYTDAYTTPEGMWKTQHDVGTASKTFSVEDFPGVGFGGYYFHGMISVLSSNKKYIITVMRGGVEDVSDKKSIGKAVGIKVDTNLNKY